MGYHEIQSKKTNKIQRIDDGLLNTLKKTGEIRKYNIIGTFDNTPVSPKEIIKKKLILGDAVAEPDKTQGELKTPKKQRNIKIYDR
jgi:hypothetical protein